MGSQTIPKNIYSSANRNTDHSEEKKTWDVEVDKKIRKILTENPGRKPRYDTVKTMLKFPLLDATIPEDKLADWIDAHTMRVHGFLDRLQQVKEDSSGYLVVTS
ncbi:hypothetical protein WJX75_008799 [Coccomyxa subellipsoidea]|uniref:Uncharacterized protein n=1 Tax=Coccomyxa subellipsoidea TaxID=248742 RepID=A0ABR2YZ58_9CHLO